MESKCGLTECGEYALPIISEYLNTIELLYMSILSDYFNKKLNNTLLIRKLFTSLEFINMPIDKIKYIHKLKWSTPT